LPRRADTFSPKQEAHLGEMAFSINSHAGEEKKYTKNLKLEKNIEEEGKVEPRRCRVVIVDHFLRHFSC